MTRVIGPFKDDNIKALSMDGNQLILLLSFYYLVVIINQSASDFRVSAHLCFDLP